MLITHKKILVTGGAGFIGSNLARRLLAMGNKVVVIDNLCTCNSRKRGNLPSARQNMKMVVADIRDYKILKANLADADLVIHAAARNQLSSVDSPQADLEVNAGGTLNVLQALLDSDACRLVYTSSSSVYGNSNSASQSEDDRLDPKSPYAISKLAGEYYCRMFSETYGLKISILRYFNVYGQGDWCGVIPVFFNRVMNDLPPLIYGDGKQTRDYTFIADAIDSTVLVAESMNWPFNVFNVGTGVETSVNEIAAKIIDLCGKSGKIIPLHIDPDPTRRVGDVHNRCANISKIQNRLGWKPKISIGEGLCACKVFRRRIKPLEYC